MGANLVVFRVGKLKTMGDVGAAAAHNARLRVTPNAAPGGKFYELVDRGGASVLDAVKEVHAEIDALCKEKKWHQRPDAVAASEIIVSASPEYFRPGAPDRAGFYEQDKLDAWLEAMVPWLKKEVGKQAKIVSMCVHLDEATPHIQVICVPRNHRGELSHRAVFGGDNRGETLSEWQTRAAEPVAHLGIERGVMGSRATHRKIKDFYAGVNAAPTPIPPVKTPKPAPLPEPEFSEKVPFSAAKAKRDELEQRAAAQLKQHQDEMLAANRARIKAFPALDQQAKDVKAAERDKRQAERAALASEKAARASAKVLDAAKAEAAQVRGLPLDEVLVKMYGAVEAADSKEQHKSRKFNLPDGTQIAVTGELWVEQGGGGGKQAINLVMHLEQYSQADFKKAVRLLADSFGGAATTAEIVRASLAETSAKVKEIEQDAVPAPEPEPGRWPKIRDWLVSVRGLPLKLVERAHEVGSVYADKIGNAVFPRKSGGAFVRGTGETPFFRTIGSSACGPVVLGSKDKSEVWCCESVIDALSIKAAYPGAYVIASGGNGVGAKALAAQVPGSATVVRLAFDNDAAGKRMAVQITPLLVQPGRSVLRAEPPAGKDWNETIIKEPGRIAATWLPDGASGTQAPKQAQKAPQPAPGRPARPKDDDPSTGGGFRP